MNSDIELRKQIGSRITKIRNELNLTKESLAKQMGITGQFLGMVEKGSSTISYCKLKKLCQISGYSADYILFGKNSNFSNKDSNVLSNFSCDQIKDACCIIYEVANYMKDNSSNE